MDTLLLDNTAVIFSTPLYISVAVIVAILILSAIFLDDNRFIFETRCITYASVTVALSTVLSLIKIFVMPQGGAITLFSALPVLLFSFFYGERKGLIVGVITGLITCAIDPFIIHPAQFLLDYPLAYACMGVGGIFNISKLKNHRVVSFILGAVVCMILRYSCHVLSGVFAFASYSTLQSTFIYSLSYNSFALIDMAISVAGCVPIVASKKTVNLLFSNADKFKKHKKIKSQENSCDNQTKDNGDSNCK